MIVKKRQREKKTVTRIGAAFLLGVVALQLLTAEDSNHGSSSSTAFLLRRILSPSDSSSSDETAHIRPRMYTFYHRVPTGSAEHVDLEVLDLWKEEWTSAGFDARIMSLDDAIANPKFVAYEKTLHENVTMHRPIGYNRMCFYRWLAMATVGGGFMSDNDVLPLQASYRMAKEVSSGSMEELPNDGKFTAFDRHVPSMLSGSAEEWDRVAAMILDAAVAQSRGEEPLGDGTGMTSDMLALLPVVDRLRGEEDDALVLDPARVIGFPQSFVDLDESKCLNLRGAPAVHFSHAALDNGFRANINRRPEIMKEWIDNWRNICGSNGAEDTNGPVTMPVPVPSAAPVPVPVPMPMPRKFSQNMLESTLRLHTTPDLDRFQCELSYREHPQASWGWHKPLEMPEVPAGSRFDVNNNFRADISTSNLDIFFMGDSVGENLADFYLDAVGADSSKSERVFKKNIGGVKQDIYWAKNLPKKKGGGTVAFARMLRLWKEKNRGDSADFRGWEPRIFEDHVKAHGNVDVLIYRTPWPWMYQEGNLLPPQAREVKDADIAGKISESDYDEVLSLAHKYLRPHTVILVTTPVNNNGIRDGFQKLRKDNEAIRSFVQNFLPSENPEDGIQNVLLLDWEKLVDAAILANAEILGIRPEKAFQHSLTGVNIKESKKRAWYPQLTAMTCSGTTAAKEPQWSTECPEDRMGRISPDGMHLCGATIGPRSSGGLACLMKCAINADGHGVDDRTSFLTQCQNVCNGLFMNMDTIFVADDESARSVSGHLEIQ